MTRTYHKVMQSHRLRFSKQVLDRWEDRNEQQQISFISNRAIICLALALGILIVLRSMV